MNAIERIERVENRLKTVESTANRWRAATICALSLLVATWVMGAAKQEERILSVEGIQIVDSRGNQRGYFGTEQEGQADRSVLRLFDNEEKLRANMQVSDDESRLILMNDQDKGLALLLALNGRGGLFTVLDTEGKPHFVAKPDS